MIMPGHSVSAFYPVGLSKPNDFFEAFYGEIKAIEVEMDVAYLDYSKDERFLNAEELFLDTDHLNEKGARVFTEIVIRGFKSIREMNLELSRLNVLIGANGAGKSNLISSFKLFNHLMSNNLQQHIATSGYADAMLYYGAKRTPQISTTLNFSTSAGKNVYHMRLVNAAQDTLIFADEAISFSRNGIEGQAPLVSLGAGVIANPVYWMKSLH